MLLDAEPAPTATTRSDVATDSSRRARRAARAARPRAKGPLPFLLLLNLVAIIALVGAGVAFVLHDDSGTTGSSSSAPRLHEYTVPMGTGRALDLGQTVDFFPRQLDVKVGDQLVIHNDDSRSHTVGPYFVNRGQTLRQTFTAPGIVKGICTIHPSGAVTIVVT